VPDGDVELALRAIDNAGNQFDAPTRTITKRFACAPDDPSLDLSPPEGARGEAVQLTASGFAPGETVTVSLVQEEKPKTKKKKKKKKGKKGKRSKRPQQPQRVMTLNSASATAAGIATLTFTVPVDAPLGRLRLDVIGTEGTRASTTFAVLPGAPRTAAAERASGPGDAPDTSDGTPPDNANPSAPTGNGPEQALPPPEESDITTAAPKRKSGKSRDRADRDDNDKDEHKAKHKTKQARNNERRSKRQRRN
jgi:hypothetical protein